MGGLMQSPNLAVLKDKIEKKYESFDLNELKLLFQYLQAELKDWDLSELFVEIREAQELFKEGEPGFDEMVVQELEG